MALVGLEVWCTMNMVSFGTIAKECRASEQNLRPTEKLETDELAHVCGCWCPAGGRASSGRYANGMLVIVLWC